MSNSRLFLHGYCDDENHDNSNEDTNNNSYVKHLCSPCLENLPLNRGLVFNVRRCHIENVLTVKRNPLVRVINNVPKNPAATKI